MKSKNRVYAMATAIIILVIIISIAIPLQNNKNEVNPMQITRDNNGLPKLESFESLYNIAINQKEEYKVKNDVVDYVEDTQATGAEKIKTDEDYSKTNIQVEGVDEADIVKTDGKYIYYVADGAVVIIGVQDELDVISKLEFDYEFNPQELYLNENKLVIIGMQYHYYGEIEYKSLTDEMIVTNDVNTVAKVYNLDNIKNPILEREIKLEGNYISSRMIEENLYLMANKGIDCYLFNDDINKMDENKFKPKYIDSVISDEVQTIEYSDVSYFPESEDVSYLSIAGFNINNTKKANIEVYLGAGSKVYCSPNNLYIANVKYDYKDKKVYGYYNNYDLNTYIYKFKLDNSKVEYQDVGSVPGSIINQFSMDENGEYFRIATTDRSSFNNETSVNNLYVLDQDLKLVGKLENLARGEKIYSVRFMQNRAYMVTFVETDPLFVINLEDPTDPTVLGELKIPGYSKYLHPYDETHIIGFGENTITNESGGVIPNGMKMALFDVSNPMEPKELYSENIGEEGTTSEILYNHKALLFSKEKNIIAFPIYITKSIEDYETDLVFQGAIVYGIDLENGFFEKGRIAHQEKEEGETFDYDYSKCVNRIIYIENNLYTLSESLIKQINMETMEEQNILELD